MRLLTVLPVVFALFAGAAHAQQYQQELEQQQNDQLLNTLIDQVISPSNETDAAPSQEAVIDAPAEAAPVQESFEPPPVQWEKQKFAVLQTLDKVTARTATLTLPVNRPSAVGPLFIDVKTCQKTPPTEQPEAAAFLQVWEAKPKSATADNRTESQWVFSGWMFASSPALSAMNHPIYDVWVKDCVNERAPSKEK